MFIYYFIKSYVKRWAIFEIFHTIVAKTYFFLKLFLKYPEY